MIFEEFWEFNLRVCVVKSSNLFVWSSLFVFNQGLIKYYKYTFVHEINKSLGRQKSLYVFVQYIQAVKRKMNIALKKLYVLTVAERR